MGFWSNVGSFLKSAAKEVASGVAKATKYVGEKLKEAGEWIDKTISNLGKKESGPTMNTSFTSSTSSSSSSSSFSSSSSSSSANEERKKKARERENEAITQYQNEVEQRAKSREKAVKETYLKIYKEYIADFEEVLDADLMDDIKSYVKKTSQSFINTLRDEVNTKVNSSYQPWKQLISSHPSPKRLQEYCDKVYTEADNNLLDLLQSAIEDTNKFISKCVIKYNDDKAKALKEMKDSLVKLTADEETKAQELKKIAEELAVAQFIANETSLDTE